MVASTTNCPASSVIYATGLDADGQVHGTFANTSDIGGTTSGIKGANGTTTGGSCGGAGAGGGIGRIRCRRFKTDGSTAASAIDFGGGKGGNGGNGSGAGSGGRGGYFSMIFAERIGAAVTNLIDVRAAIRERPERRDSARPPAASESGATPGSSK